MTYKQHPLSCAFPAMGADAFQALKDSIENLGVQNPITLFDGMVIDGWHRYTAAMDLGMPCPTVELGDIDPRDFVLAQNKARRHITAMQLALATTAVFAWYPADGSAQRGGVEVPATPPKSNAELAAIAGVSEKTIQQAKAVQTKAAPEVVAAVKAGVIGGEKAAKIANLPKDQQADAIAKPTPKAAPEIEPQAPDYTALDAAHDQISDLQHDVERLNDRLAVGAIDASDEEKAAASETIAALRAEVRTLGAHLDAVTLSRDTLQEENAQLKKQCQMYRNKLDKLSA